RGDHLCLHERSGEQLHPTGRAANPKRGIHRTTDSTGDRDRATGRLRQHPARHARLVVVTVTVAVEGDSIGGAETNPARACRRDANTDGAPCPGSEEAVIVPNAESAPADY